MGEKITKDQINGSDLYFLKKIHIILILIGFIVFNTLTLSGLYYTLKSDVTQNSEAITELKKSDAIQDERLDNKHDAILELRLNLKNYMQANGFNYIEAEGLEW